MTGRNSSSIFSKLVKWQNGIKQPKPSTAEKYIVAVDWAKGKDITVLNLAEKTHLGTMMLGQFVDSNLLAEKDRTIAELTAQLENSMQLPCKVGDIIYTVYQHWNYPDQYFIQSHYVEKFSIFNKDRVQIITGTGIFALSDLGSSWFLTKPEAEARLKELKEAEQRLKEKKE